MNKTVVALIVLGAAGIMAFYLMPLIVGAAADTFNLNARQQGSIASAELSGVCAASLCVFVSIHRVNKRKLAVLGLILAICGNLSAIIAWSYSGILLTRLMAGFGGGALLSLAVASLATMPHPDRNFGLLISAEYILAAAGFFILPSFLAAYGIDGLFGVLAGILVCCTPLLIWVPGTRTDSGEAPEMIPRGVAVNKPAVVGIAALGVYSIGFAGVWVYLERIGRAAGLMPQSVAYVLSLALVMSIAGALTTAALGARINRLIPLTVAVIAQVSALSLFVEQFDFLTFVLSVCLLCYFWNITFPYLFAIVAVLDESGRYTIAGNIAALVGTAVGPISVGWLLFGQDYSVVNYFGIGAMLVCWLLAMVSLFLKSRVELKQLIQING